MKNSTNSHPKLSDMVFPLLQWYDCHARILPWRENPVPYAVWISEIMLQQTRVEAVKPFFDRWMAALPDLSCLVNASEAQVLKLWEGLGYYSRVRNIHKASKQIMEKHDGALPASYECLLSLPGIGEYTAGAIGSIAFQLPVPCVDGNVLRVVTRITMEDGDITATATKRMLTEQVREIIPKDRPGDFNQAMMELGATICLPSGPPKCEICPISFLCEAHQQNRMTEFPIKAIKKPRKIEEKTILILICGNKVALRKRPETGLLAGLWEFPSIQGTVSLEEIRKQLCMWGFCLTLMTKLNSTKHIFTHIEWKMTGYLAFLEKSEGSLIHTGTPDFQWIEKEQLINQLTLPSAFKVYYQDAMKALERYEILGERKE